MYLHFYILCCCQGLNFGWASLHKPAKCNKISQRWKSHSSRSIFSNSEFLSFLQPRLSKVTSSGCFSLFENCAISNTSRRFSNHCNSNCVSWIAMCYNLQSIARSCNYCVLQCRPPTWSSPARNRPSSRPARLAGLVRRHRYPSTKHSMGATLSKPPTEKMVDF